jgi:HlyD family secretion protein
MRALLVLVALAGLGLGAARWLRGSSAAAADVATFTIAKTRFTRRVHADGNLRAVKATRLNAPQMPRAFGAMKLAWVARDGTLVHAGEPVARFDPSEPEKQLKSSRADREQADIKQSEEQVKAKASAADRQSEADLAEAELVEQRKFQSKDQQIFSRNQIIESEIDEGLATAREQHAQQAKRIETHVSASNAGLIAVDQRKADLGIRHASQALASMELDAPHDGILVLQRNHKGELPKLGDSLWPGQQIAELPELDAMEAEVFVLEVDGNGLAEKQSVQLIIEARPDVSYAGKIKLVERLAQPREEGSPVQYFAVVIALDKTDQDVMKPGQRVQATILIDDQDALVVPREAIVDRDGKNVVFRRSATGFEAVPVELGAATTGRVVIKSGVAVGDVIALRDPTQARPATGSASAAGSQVAP